MGRVGDATANEYRARIASFLSIKENRSKGSHEAIFRKPLIYLRLWQILLDLSVSHHVGTVREVKIGTDEMNHGPLIGSLSYKLPILTPATTTAAPSSSSSSSRKRSRPSSSSLLKTGWVLNDEWMISMASRRHFQLAATAIRCNRLVQINSYRQLSDSCCRLLEIDDLILLPKDDDDDEEEDGPSEVVTAKTRHDDLDTTMWTLREISRLERLDAATAKIEGRGRRVNQQKKQLYSFQAFVVAISPIIIIDKNPFALMELSDDDDNNDLDSDSLAQSSCHCCLVVIRGAALLYAESVAVGDGLHLHQVRRQEWRIPTICPTAPSAVFVLQDVTQLTWRGQSSPPPLPIHNHQNNTTTNFRGTSSVLHQLSGTIRSVHWLTTKTCNTITKQLHCIELSNNNNDDDSWWILVTYFPMSMALQCSLRPGAQIVANHLHRISSGTRTTTAWGANLQSQLIVVQFSPRTLPISTTLSSSSVTLNELTPYAWHRRIRQSYTQLCWKRQLTHHILSSFRNDAFVDNSSLPSVDTLLAPFFQLSNSLPTRNAYAEFLSNNTTDMMTVPPGTICDSVANIRAMAMTQLVDRLQKNKAVGVGWNASFRVDLKMDDATSTLYTLGYWTTYYKEGMMFGSLSDGDSEIPIVLQDGIKGLLPESSLFTWVEIQAVYMSCICIDDAVGLFGEPRIKNLPCHQSNKSLHGGASLVLIDGRLYVADILVTASGIKYVGDRTLKIPTRCSTATHQYVTVEECLRMLNLSPRPIQGMLVRSWWTPTKLKSSIFNGLEVTVGHASSSDDDDDDPNRMVSLLQTIDFKPRVAIHKLEDFVGIVKAFTEGCAIPSANMILGAVWWKLADDVSLCSLLMGGWDDGQVPLEAASAVTTMIAIPASSLMRDPKRGFVRFRCSIDDLVVSLSSSSFSKKTNVDSTALFDFESRSRKVVAGMLHRRIKRIGTFHEAILSPGTRLSGIPSQSISRVFSDLLDDLRTQSRQHMRPSLVRAIPNATFLGVSYCRAHAACSKCYQELKLPPPLKTKTANDFAVGSNNNNNKDRHTTTLECPNGCDVRRHGFIKWECSGILDDSTGQAKLYSEREAAMFLLTGMSEKRRHFIEQGVWSMDGGVVFSKTTPPKSSLQYAVKSARMAAAQSWKHHPQQQGRRRRSISITEDDVLQHMEPRARAEYLLEWTCRCPPLKPATTTTTTTMNRHRLYFVRCKPLADFVVHVSQTDVQLANRQDGIFTYTLPPLQLTLVDCAMV